MFKNKIITGILSSLLVCVLLFGIYVFWRVRNFTPQGRLKVDKVKELQTLNTLREAVRLAPADPQAHMALANYLASGIGISFHPEKALEHYLKAEQLAPDDPQILKKVAWVRYRQKKYHEVIKYAERIINLDPSMAQDAYQLLAQSNFRLGQHVRAAEYYEKISPPVQSAELGRAYFYIGRYEDSLRIFQTFPSKKEIPRRKSYGMDADESGVAFYYMGLCYVKTGRNKEAKKAFREAIALFNVAKSNWHKKEIAEIKSLLKEL